MTQRPLYLAIMSAIMAVNPAVNAESDTGTAQVTVLSAISLQEDQVVDFKYIPNDNGYCVMAANGSLSGQCAGQPDGTPGKFTISGTPNQAVEVTVGSASTVDGVMFLPELAENNSTSIIATLDGSGEAIIDIIGQLGVFGATPGAKTLNYVLTVDYQ